MTKKVDMFKADRAMADRVAEFMTMKVWGITLKVRLNKDIKKLEDSIQGLENCRGSMVGVDVDVAIARNRALIDDKRKKYEEQVKNEALFAWTDADNAFFKAYRNAETMAQVYTALEKWFEVYHLDVAQTNLEDDIINAIRGGRNATARQIINSGATRFTTDKRAKNDVLKLIYGKLSEKMLEVGTLKPATIPEDVREYYAPKKANK